MSHINEASLSLAKQHANLFKGVIAGIKSDYGSKTSLHGTTYTFTPNQNTLLGKVFDRLSVAYIHQVDFSTLTVKTYNDVPFIVGKVYVSPERFRIFSQPITSANYKEDIVNTINYFLSPKFKSSYSYRPSVVNGLGLDSIDSNNIKSCKLYKELEDLASALFSTTLTTTLHPKAIKAVKDRDYIPFAWLDTDKSCGKQGINVPITGIGSCPLNSNKYRSFYAFDSSVSPKKLGQSCIKYTPFRSWCIPDISPLGSYIDLKETLEYLKLSFGL